MVDMVKKLEDRRGETEEGRPTPIAIEGSAEWVLIIEIYYF
jgi:hypothetical protein